MIVFVDNLTIVTVFVDNLTIVTVFGNNHATVTVFVDNLAIVIVRGQPRYCDRVVVVVSEAIQPETWTLSSRWIGAGQSGRVASSEATEFSSAVDAQSSTTTIAVNTCNCTLWLHSSLPVSPSSGCA